MKNILRGFQMIYFFWGIGCLVLISLVMMPFFYLIILRKQWHKNARYLSKIWSRAIFFSIGIPVKVIYKFNPEPKKNYIYCSNHTSYLDIPVCECGLDRSTIFIGKNSLSRIPFFGYVFRKLHIPVDRGNRKDSYRAYQKAKASLDGGQSLFFFPEGKINEGNPRKLKNFKLGAFKIAIEKQVPIVPVSIPYNWKILHDSSLYPKWNKTTVIFHKPIETKGLFLDDVETLKKKTLQVIQKELQTHLGTANSSR